MRERIVANCDYGMRELSDAPIQTFHSLCHDILMEHGFEGPDAPRYRRPHHWIHTRPRRRERREGAVPRIHPSIQRRPPRVRRFLPRRRRTSRTPRTNQSARSEGVFPTADGWYRNGERHLDGDFEAFREIFDELNQPRNDGDKQSSFARNSEATGTTSATSRTRPEEDEIRGGWGEKASSRCRRTAGV